MGQKTTDAVAYVDEQARLSHEVGGTRSDLNFSPEYVNIATEEYEGLMGCNGNAHGDIGSFAKAIQKLMDKDGTLTETKAKQQVFVKRVKTSISHGRHKDVDKRKAITRKANRKFARKKRAEAAAAAAAVAPTTKKSRMMVDI